MTTRDILSRRSLLRLAGVGAGALIMSGCGGDDGQDAALQVGEGGRWCRTTFGGLGLG